MAMQWIANRCFTSLHQRNLVYNTCWEDPRVDRQALQLTADDTVVVITSAGCNALDYALDAPKRIIAVDVNPIQNALLELKIAAIKTLSHEEFFQVFGCGSHAAWRSMYHDAIREHLSEPARMIWDQRQNFFDGTHRRQSFYFRGSSGLFAWAMNRYLNFRFGLRDAVNELLDARDVEHQREIYHRHQVDDRLWSRSLSWAIRRDTTMAMLGVPRSQRCQIDRGYVGGLGQFIRDRIDRVFQVLPLADNYFWRVYLTGEYSRDCCPEYLKPDSFERLKAGLVHRISVCTDTVEGYLRGNERPISRFVLLDHMDWLVDQRPQWLQSEWQAIIDRATSGARVLWRSAAPRVDFVDPIEVRVDRQAVRVGDLLRHHNEWALSLHDQDRVSTYGSFCIADVAKLAA